MIKFEEFDNKRQMLSCNSCYKDGEKKLYNVMICGNSSVMVVRLCKECAKALRDSIKFRK